MEYVGVFFRKITIEEQTQFKLWGSGFSLRLEVPSQIWALGFSQGSSGRVLVRYVKGGVAGIGLHYLQYDQQETLRKLRPKQCFKCFRLVSHAQTQRVWHLPCRSFWALVQKRLAVIKQELPACHTGFSTDESSSQNCGPILDPPNIRCPSIIYKPIFLRTAHD